MLATAKVTRPALLLATVVLFSGCSWFEHLFGLDDDEELQLVGCLAANGSPSLSHVPPAVPSVTPWLADIPGLGPTLDVQLTGTVYHAAGVMQVAPAVRYYDDGTAPNAMAIPVNTEASENGTVRVGVNMVATEARRFLTTEYGVTRYYTYSITAVLAHELGHIVQFERAMPAPSRNTELQADFLAGWYFSVLADVDPNFASNSGFQDGVNAFFQRGDYMFNSPGHHGTPQQRAAAFVAGYNANANGIDAAWAASVAYRQQLGG
jgi:hypothetical protein